MKIKRELPYKVIDAFDQLSLTGTTMNDIAFNNNQIIPEISNKLNFNICQVENVLSLTEEDNTVHFIARYRKERTGNLDENDIRSIIDLKKKIDNLIKAKER